VNAAATAASEPAADEHCPACRAPLGRDQQWCLECGAAARTRIAPTPGWRAPLAIAAAIIVLALAALTFALVHLARPGATPRTVSVTVTTPAPTTPPTSSVTGINSGPTVASPPVVSTPATP
jgi:hypothetical protein